MTEDFLNQPSTVKLMLKIKFSLSIYLKLIHVVIELGLVLHLKCKNIN